MTWLNITSIICNVLSCLAIITAFTVFIANFVIKNKNLKLFNRYCYLIRIAPIIWTYGEKILDNYAGYTLKLNNTDKTFNAFNLHRLKIANRRLKRINNDIESFVEAYKKICPQHLLGFDGEFSFTPPFYLMKFSFDTNWGNQKLTLKYHLKDIDISNPLFLVFNFELNQDVITYFKLTPKQLFYLNDHRCFLLPNYHMIKKEDIIKDKTIDFNCMVDNDYYHKFLFLKFKRKYPVRSYQINKISQCSINDKKFIRINSRNNTFDYFPNSRETNEKFF